MTTNTKPTAVVTGATSGLGEAAAVALGRAGWRVILVGRDAARGAETAARVQAGGGTAEFLAADLFSLADVRRLAGVLRGRAPSLDLLINNAGGTFSRVERTQDGLERTFALNVAAPFVLTQALLEPLAAARGRIVNVVTGVPRGAKATLDQLLGERAGAGVSSYMRSKLALMALTREQQRRHGGRGLTAVSLHPGIIVGTRFGSENPGWLRAIAEGVARLFRLNSTLEEAAARYLRVGTEPVEGGGFYKEGTLAPAPVQAEDARFAAELWARLEALEGR